MEKNHLTYGTMETPSAEWTDGSLNEVGPSYLDQSIHGPIFREEESDQPSLGGLNEQPQGSKFETIEEKYEDLEVEVIQHFTAIRDYKTPTDLKYPIVAKTPRGYFCLDGWSLVEEAKAGGQGSMNCAVEYLANHSEEELAIRKTALRVKTRAGDAGYAEKIRNVRRLHEMLLTTNSDLRGFHHGGARKGEAFTNNKQENVIKVLAHRLGRSVATINQYLSHGRYLSDETLNLLAGREANKDFFEKANSNKTGILTRLKSERKSDAEITDRISTKMMEWLREYEQTKKIEPIWKEPEPSPSEESQEGDTQTPVPSEITEEEKEEEEVFNPWRGNPEEPESDSFPRLKRDTGDLAKRLSEAVTLDDPNLFCDRIIEEEHRLHQISLRAASLLKM